MSSKPSAGNRPGDDAPRGLPSITQAREDRRKRKSMLPARFWMWAAVLIGAALIVWWKIEQGEINSMRNELLGKQRAAVEELGPRWFPLRDKIEGWTTECAREAFVEHIDDEIKNGKWEFRRDAGIYLRLAQPSAATPDSIREAATKSLHDGFTSCLFVVDNPSPLAGPPCETTVNCPVGQMCNEFNHCAEHSKPYNLRLAFKTLEVITDKWVANIQDVGSKLEMRGAQATFEDVSRYDLPAAANLLQRSKYYLAVVDEPVDDVDEEDIEEALPEVADAGAEDDRSIPTAAHPARVCVWRLSDDRKMLAVRREANGVLRGPMSQKVGLQTRIAQKRQANSCALALHVRAAMGADTAAKIAPDEPEPATTDAGAADADVGN